MLDHHVAAGRIDATQRDNMRDQVRTMTMSDSPHTLVPFERVGPFRFGASPAECAAEAGAPDRSWDDDILELHLEQRGAAELTYSEGARLLVDGVDVFGAPNAAEQLRAAHPGATEQKQYLNLPDLGLCLGGFGKRKLKEGRLAIAYAPSERVMMGFLGAV